MGGAGTVYVELINATTSQTIYRKIHVNNNGIPYPKAPNTAHGDLRNLLDGEYDDISEAGGVTWLYHNSRQYFFNEMTIEGNAHVAILSNTSHEAIDIRGERLYGDRTGVLHSGKNQTFGFLDVDVYMPINIMSYR